VGDAPDRDSKLDETLDETFPASDPPANTGETGIRLAIDDAAAPVKDNHDLHRFEIEVDGQTAVLVYERTPKSLVLVHTEVPPALRGRHLGDALARVAIDAAHAGGLQIIAVCPFVKAYLKKHPIRSTS